MAERIHETVEVVKNADRALFLLTEGNKRFVTGKGMIECNNTEDERDLMQKGQHPFAAVLACSDSRVSPTVLFDQTMGDLFVIRNAGNVANMTAMGSAEYASEYLNVPLIVVCGHSSCGAVSAAFEQAGGLPENLKESIDGIAENIKSSESIDKAEKANIKAELEKVRANKTVRKNGTKVVGAYFIIKSGKVQWID